MASTKRKVSVTLDEDLLELLEGADENLSAQVNDAVRHAVEHRMRQRGLRKLLDDLETSDGPIHEDDVQYFIDLLS